MSKYAAMTSDDFDSILVEIVDEENASSLFQVPGVHALVSEYFNNDVLARWANEHPVEAWQGEHAKTVEKVRSMPREVIVQALATGGLPANPDGDIETLRDGLFSLLSNGLIDEADLEA